MSDAFYRINEPHVSTEDFQTEILAVNLKSGHYHSMRGSAVPVWRLLTEGYGSGEIAKILGGHYQIDSARASAAVLSLVQDLEKTELLVKSEGSEASPQEAPAWLVEIPREFSEPLLESYTDMEELLLLDPIHDVDGAGWPHAAPPAA